ncbi:hypothetical protein Ari01nite_61360 [Paractinoplanes rishiriensis]|uniref:Uncharacterized protein n=1 Tax=Paractinoplanes rishiriensis TaxID=1050105 RepID=A0A919K0J6_9ACTN|nr:hypothetical protein Ari01nite_61360 [Actinoplanes rishiriensis]
MFFLALGDIMLGYELAQGTGGRTTVWQWTCWIVAHFLLATAPVVQCRHAAGHRLQTDERRARVASKLPGVRDDRGGRGAAGPGAAGESRAGDHRHAYRVVQPAAFLRPAAPGPDP